MTIVGAGVAGVRTAQSLRKHGHKGFITLLDSEPYLPYDKPPLSKKVLTGELELREIHLADEPQLAELDVRYVPSRGVAGLDVKAAVLHAADGSELPYDQLVVATGAVPRELPLGHPMENVFTLRTVDDSLRIREAAKNASRACVVGGGVLGAEIAASLRYHDLDVTIVELAPGLLFRSLRTSAVAAAVLALHETAGIHVRLNMGVLGLVGGKEADGVTLADGTTLPTDLVVVALGIRPDTSWLDGSGLVVDDGLVCDETLRASRSNVWGAGDVVRVVDAGRGTSERAEHWTSAVEQADVVARNLLAAPDEHVPFRPAPYVWSDQHGERIQTIGSAPEGSTTEEVLHHKEHPGRLISLFGTGGRFTGAAAIGMPRPIARLRPLLAQEADFDVALELARSLV